MDVPAFGRHRLASTLTGLAAVLVSCTPAKALEITAPLPQTPVQVPETQVTAPGAKVQVGGDGAAVNLDPNKAVGAITLPPPATPTPSASPGGASASNSSPAPGAGSPAGTESSGPRPSGSSPGSTPAGGAGRGAAPPARRSVAGASAGAAPADVQSAPSATPNVGSPDAATREEPARRGVVMQVIEKIPTELLAALVALALFGAAMSLVWLRERRRLRAAWQQAQVDPLTGIPNRLAFEQQFTAEWKRARRYERPLGVVLLDLDGLKQVNDRHGHEAGDAMIKAAATGIAEHVRQSDLAARLAGDEFVVLCPETRRHGLEQLGAKLVERLHHGGIAASVGWAELTDRDVAPGDLLTRADAAMYQEKARRRAGHPTKARPGLAIAG